VFVAKALVDGLEVVQVQNQDGAAFGFGPIFGERLGQKLTEPRSVGQAGGRIKTRLALDLGLLGLQLDPLIIDQSRHLAQVIFHLHHPGHVADLQQAPPLSAVGRHRPNLDALLDGLDRAGAVGSGKLIKRQLPRVEGRRQKRGIAPLQRPSHRPVGGPFDQLGHHLFQLLAHRLFGADPRNLRHPVVPDLDVFGGINDDHPLLQGVDEGLVKIAAHQCAPWAFAPSRSAKIRRCRSK
jgi:hypothetical protein